MATMEPAAIAEAAELVFSALPNGASAELAPELLAAGLPVVDLAGDFRLPADAYPTWYGFEHPAAGWLDKAVYGLPELFADRVAGAKLVANPGCFPTPTVLGLAPLLAAGLVEPGAIRVDGKTGLSGAGRCGRGVGDGGDGRRGRSAPIACRATSTRPEMERGLALATGLDATVLFVPHLVPAFRGVVVTAYASLAPGGTTEALTSCLRDAYAEQPFVRVLTAGEMVDSTRTLGTNVVELQAVADDRTGTAVVVGALDNLVKGAAGQAIQNANLLLGVAQETGLPTVAVDTGGHGVTRDLPPQIRQRTVAKARTLLEALPFMREHAAASIVVKYGGAAMESTGPAASFAEDVELLRSAGMKPVVVHGGGPAVTAMSARLGIETTFVDGVRVTDAETLDVATMVLAGKLNTDVVSGLVTGGVRRRGALGRRRRPAAGAQAGRRGGRAGHGVRRRGRARPARRC